MRLEEDVYSLKQELGDIRQESFAMELIRESNAKNKIYEKQNHRLFIIIIVMMLLWFVTGSYLVYILNDIQVIEEQSSVDMEAEGNNNYIGGDNNGTYESN